MPERTLKAVLVKMDQEEDRDIIRFLLDRPRTWTIKKALRDYMEKVEQLDK